MTVKRDSKPKGFAYEANEKDHWITPVWLLDGLEKAGGQFDLDPCAAPKQPWPCAARSFSLPKHNGLLLDWSGRVWCNPPYGKELPKWIERMNLHDNGMLLMYARTGTNYFQRLWRFTDSIFFFKNRIQFCTQDGALATSPTADNVIACFGKSNTGILERALREGLLKGSLVRGWTTTGAFENQNG
jgi:hypothetical protein